MRPCNVARENRRSKSVHRIISEGDRFGFSSEGCDGNEGAEDLFAEDAHGGVDVAEDGGGDEEVCAFFMG